MGNILIIKGADFSANAVSHDDMQSTRVITPNFIDGNAILTPNGDFESNQNQKYCEVNLQTNDISVIIRGTGYARYGIAFFNENVYVSGVGFDDFDVHTVEIPQGSTKFKYSYLTDSRAIELSKPVVSSIDIQYERNS